MKKLLHLLAIAIITTSCITKNNEPEEPQKECEKNNTYILRIQNVTGENLDIYINGVFEKELNHRATEDFELKANKTNKIFTKKRNTDIIEYTTNDKGEACEIYTLTLYTEKQ
ncbi:hypothetical protein D0T49_12955 [Paludibacter sp. 221]|uniref:hypothetical protein n=1 Tax=Paludibacter sp. 221 TaxID=2302939 RepID=UPI0013D0864E|nr:hypothetical protein [Paludibacter sp. 221]NDV47953.1 hypothetical protein [Paludibacter sp. 221]